MTYIKQKPEQFQNVSNMTYDSQGALTSFTADGTNYTITYTGGKMQIIAEGGKTVSIAYNGDMFQSITTT